MQTDFKPLYYTDRLQVINLYGDVSITTLWSRPAQIMTWMSQQRIDISPQTSRIAVIANLYGNGLPQMLRNLLFNPQIRYILVLGQNLSGSREELVNFFHNGLEETVFLGSPAHRIKGTSRIIDNLINPTDFKNNLQITSLDTLDDPSTQNAIKDFFAQLPPQQSDTIDRQHIPLPKIEIRRFPSEPRHHNILQTTPLAAWQELIFRLSRFGHRNQLKKGERIELQNTKVIIEEPLEESEELLAEYGFSLAHFKEYQKNLLSANLLGQPYSYGHRLHAYFQLDTIDAVIKLLHADRESRHAYISLWDTHCDLARSNSVPCLVSLYFRYFAEKLTLTATFRTHNAVSAWLENIYGLMEIQNYVATQIAVPVGAMTVFSHSMSIDNDSLAKAELVVKNRAFTMNFDPHGDFAVTIDKSRQEIVVQQTYQGTTIAEYRGKTSFDVEQQLARDCALSDIAHALYLGREIAKKEMLLKG